MGLTFVRMRVGSHRAASSGFESRRRCHNNFGDGELREAEIEDLHRVPALAIRLEPDIVGLEIAVQQAGAMRLLDGRTHLFENVHRPRERQTRLLAKHVREGASIEELHHQIREAPARRCRIAEVGDIDDVRVTKRTRRPRLPFEAAQKTLVARKGRNDDLQGDTSSRVCVHGAKHRAHASLSKKTLDVVLAVNQVSNLGQSGGRSIAFHDGLRVQDQRPRRFTARPITSNRAPNSRVPEPRKARAGIEGLGVKGPCS